MKKILSLLVCMCMLIGMLPVFTVNAADVPTWVASIGTSATPGTLIADYSFANTDIPGQAIPNNFPTDATTASNKYAAEYTSEGFKITRLEDGTNSNATTASGLGGRINFVSVTDKATKSYESGFRGTYVVEITVKSDMSRPSGVTKNARFDMSFGYNEDITSRTNSNTTSWNNMRLMHDNTWRLYNEVSSGATEYLAEGGDRTLARGEDETFRFVFDTVNSQVAFFKLTDGEYAYIGSGDMIGDSVQGITFTPRLGFAKGSYFIFKNVKIYEVTRAQEPLIKVDNTTTTPDPDPTPNPEPGEEDEVADPNNNIPDWVELIGAKSAPGTLVDSHSFSNSDVSGRKVYNSYTDSTNFSGEYTADGFVLSRVSEFTSGTGNNPSDEFMRINLTKKVGDEYKYGLKGTYAIDLTVNGELASSQKKSDVYLDGYIVSSDSADSLTTSNNTNVKIQFIAEQGKTGNTHFKVSSASNSSLATELAPIPVDTDTVVRLIIDTETGNLALYTSEDNKATFKFYGAIDGVFNGDKINGFMFNPGLGLLKPSTMTFKNIDIYEITEVEDTQNPDPTPDPEPGDDQIVADPSNNIPDWAEVIGLTKEPGKKVGDYKITGSDVPGESIANTLNASGDFSGEYTEDGFVWTKLTEPVAADRATQSGVGGVLQIVANVENDETNGTSTYQHGLVGTYVVDLYVNSNLSMNLTGNAARFDWNIGYQSDLTNGSQLEKTFNTVRVNSGDGSNPFTVYGSSAYQQGDRGLPKGEDSIVRFVIDTNAKEMAYFIYKNNEFVFSGSGAYSGDIIQSMYFTPRLGFAKGSTFTFKGVKIYEIKKYINPDLGTADRNQQIIDTMADKTLMPATLVSNPSAVTENITLPAGTWTTSNDSVITTQGGVKRGYDDEEVYLTNKFKTNSTPSLQLFKSYKLNVLKRADVVNEVIGETELNASADSQTSYLVNRAIAEDENSTTYVNNLAGVYDFEFEVTPSMSGSYAEGGKPAVIVLGYYDENAAKYTVYANAYVYSDVIRYASNASSETSVPVKNGEKNTIVFRVDTVNKQLWVYVNGVKSAVKPYTGSDYVNAFTTYMDANAASGDSLVLNKFKLVSLFAFDNSDFANADMLDCSEAIKSITMADVTANPQDAYGALGNLPETVGGYKVEWTADSDYVDIASKYAYRSAEDTDVVVTAKVYDSENPEICVLKDFDITIKGTTDPELLLEGSTSKLAAKFITNQPADGLITDIVLPESVMGNSVTWTVSPSSPSDVLSADGKINKNKDISEPTKVTLIATVTNGTATVTKEVEFTVAKRGGDVTLYTSSADIETPITGVVTYEADLNGTATLVDSEGKKIITLDGNGIVKVVMDFNNSKVSVFKDGVLVSDYVDFAEEAENFAAVASSDVSNEKIILDEYALYNYNIEKFGYLDVLGSGYVTDDVDMKTTTVGGTVVTWNSGNTALLANDGTYNAPFNVSFIDVDFSITLPGGTGAKYTETLDVVAIPEDNIFAGSDVSNQGVSVPAGEYQTAMMFDGNYSDTMFRGSYADETKSIIVDMKNAQDINTVFVANDGLKSFDVYVSSDKNEWTLVAQPVLDGTLEKNLVTFERQNARYVKISNIAYDGDYADIYEIAGFVVYDSSDKSYMDILEIDMPEEYILTATSLTLPTTGSLYGSSLTWKSSNPDVISTNGTVTKPKNNTEVLLTVTSKNGTATSTKTFRYYVKGSSGAQGGTSAGGSGGGGGGVYIGDNSSSAFPETNTTVQTPVASTDKLFKDVETTDWFYAYVLDLKNENIIDGDDNNCFNPDNYVTREEFVKMIVNAAGIELVANGEGFVDVNSSAWYAPYVYAAKNNGIVNGTSANTFGVGSPISRQDMSVIINNIVDVDADISTNRDTFKDDASISAYAYEAVYAMKSLGILNGYENGNFNPQGNLTRAEAAKVIAMVMDIIK